MDLLQSSADFVGVDLGTSSCKVAVVDLHGGIKATSAKRYTIEVGHFFRIAERTLEMVAAVCVASL